MAPKTRELIGYARNLLAACHPMTLRQLHYQIFSRGEVEYANTQAEYKRLSRVTTEARNTYRAWQLADDGSYRPEFSIPPEHMVDETRAPETACCWYDVTGFLDTMKRIYRRDNWQAQPRHVEVWSEKATILGSIRPITEKWGVTMRVLHGFGSTGMTHDAGRLFEGIAWQDKRITVFFLGDHDPSGRVIEQDIHRRVETASGIRFEMTRLAIHAEDITTFDLPPQPIKSSDSRAAGFRRTFGDSAATVELDALPPEELRRRIDEAIAALVELEQWSRDLRVQEVEYATIGSVVAQVKAAMPGGTACP